MKNNESETQQQPKMPRGTMIPPSLPSSFKKDENISGYNGKAKLDNKKFMFVEPAQVKGFTPYASQKHSPSERPNHTFHQSRTEDGIFTYDAPKKTFENVPPENDFGEIQEAIWYMSKNKNPEIAKKAISNLIKKDDLLYSSLLFREDYEKDLGKTESVNQYTENDLNLKKAKQELEDINSELEIKKFGRKGKSLKKQRRDYPIHDLQKRRETLLKDIERMKTLKDSYGLSLNVDDDYEQTVNRMVERIMNNAENKNFWNEIKKRYQEYLEDQLARTE